MIKKCAYCGKEHEEEKMKKAKLIYRGRDEYTRKACVLTRECLYCPDKPCAAHNQMAHEG